MRSSLDIHCIAIGGTGMAPTACLLKALGHRVRGSDRPLYPPMSDLLAAEGIEPLVGYRPEHLAPRPDLVVVGNAVPRSNPEAVETERLGVERVSMPEALYRFCLRTRRRWVVAGTHGKTTTTSMAAWALSECGREPGYLIGGIPVDLGRSFDLGRGDAFVIEGDEYNAAYFDRGPKFLHYRPDVLILTSVEYDHADLYPSPKALTEVYAQLVASVPADGVVVAYDAPDVRRVVESAAQAEVIFYGDGPASDVRASAAIEVSATGTRVPVVGPGGRATLDLRVPGRHNLANALAVWAAAVHEGVEPADAAAGLGSFRGVRRRMEEVGRHDEVVVIDDFAHHPTAVGVTIEAARQRFPGHRVVAVFEPRSLTASRDLFQSQYEDAFADADAVVLAPVFYAERLAPNERLDLERIREVVGRRGVDARMATTAAEVVEIAAKVARPGPAVVVCMSSGSFDGAPGRIVERLRASSGD